MLKKKNLHLLIAGVLSTGLVACNSSSGPSGDTENKGESKGSETGTGYYLDSPVSGVKYTCGARTGSTDTDGAFTFEKGKKCTFFIGGVVLREAPADQLVDQVKIVEDDLKVARFLQSIDTDGDPSNGIQITDEVLDILEQALKDNGITTVPEGDDLVSVVSEVQNMDASFKGGVKTEAEVKQHLKKTQEEVVKELLGGKTYYGVFMGPEHSNPWYRLVEITPNKTLTSLTSTIIDSSNGESGSNTTSIRLEGNKFIFLDGYGGYTVIGANRGDYIEGTDYHDDGTLDTTYRIYFDKDKARAYYESVKANAGEAGGGSSGGSKHESNSYFPIVVGNTWVYQEGGDKKIAKITKSIDINGVTTYKYDGLFSDPESLYLTSTSNSIIVNAIYHEGQLDTSGYPIVWLKIPSSVGERWTAFGKKMVTISSNETVAVPAGNFPNTYLLRMTAKWGSLDIYLAKGVGIVKMVKTEDGTSKISELSRYTVQ